MQNGGLRPSQAAELGFFSFWVGVSLGWVVVGVGGVGGAGWDEGDGGQLVE